MLGRHILLIVLLLRAGLVVYCMYPSCQISFPRIHIDDAIYAVNNLQIVKSHNDNIIAVKLKELVHRALNHRILLNDTIDLELNRHSNVNNYKVLTMEEVVGSSISDYYIARNALFQFNIINKLPWAKVHTSNELQKYFQHIDSSHHKTIETNKLNLFTLVRCYRVIWSLNPCRIVQKSVIYDKKYHGHRISQLGFATLKGHLINGDEMFRVKYNCQTNKVTFQLYSITRGRYSYQYH